MEGSVGTQKQVPDAETLKEIRGHTKASRMLEAWAIARQYDDPVSWRSREGRYVASILLDNLGATRLARALDWRNLREHPDSPKCFLRGQFVRAAYAGPVRVLRACEERLRSRPDLREKPRADLLAMVAALYGSFRDFERATSFIAQALELADGVSWIHVCKAQVLEHADRYEEALESAQRAAELRPLYRPAVLCLEACLIHLGRDEEAEELLRKAHEEAELAAFAGRLVIYHRERGDHEGGLWALDEFERLSPLADRYAKDWLAARRADFHYTAGRIGQAIEFCKRIEKGEFHKKVGNRLAELETPERKRRMLEVPFVRQHNMTCAPATLAGIAKFWGHEHDHLEIAGAICYDGTPWHKERSWAEGAGYHVREFRVTRESAVALIERGIPFTLSTSGTTTAHLQACIGYDDRLGVLLLRDPTHRHFGEILLDGLIEEHPVEGPRGMMLVPEDRGELIEGLALPDESLYEERSRLSAALDVHDRLAAFGALTTMRAIDPQHPLTLMAQGQLASYDRDWHEELRVGEELAARFPKNQRLKYGLLLSLGRLGRRERRLEILGDLLGRHDSDPVFDSEMGELVAEDARESGLAEYYLRKAVRRQSLEARTHASLAWCYWKQRRFEEARDCRRLACCLAPGFEPYAQHFFDTSLSLGEREAGLAFLRARVTGTGGKYSGPWMTLIDGMEKLGRHDAAREALQEALRALPEDGDLRLAASRKFLGWGEIERAGELLERACGSVDETAWRAEAAVQAAFLGKRKTAIRYRRAVLELVPHHLHSHAVLARLLAEEEGRAVALKHLAAAWEAYPDNADLLELYAEWVEQDGPEQSIPLLMQALGMRPNSVWTRRELACEHLRANNFEEAGAMARSALDLDPQDPVSHSILGWVHESAHRAGQAAECYRRALELDIDQIQSVNGLMRCLANNREAVANLSFLHEEMERQVSNGAIVPVYREWAHRFLDQEHVLNQLEGFCEERPDLSETWMALKDQGIDMNRLDIAERAVRELSERFPLVPRTWMEVAEVHRMAGDLEKEVEALTKAVELSPAWDVPARRLADALELQGRYEEAIRMLERAIDWEPLNAPNHGCLADLLWRMGRREEAFDRLRHCLELNADYSWGWSTWGEWGAILERREEVEHLLEHYRAQKAGDVKWWLVCADVYENLGDVDAALECNAAGRAIDGRNADLIDGRAYLLCTANRAGEALELLDGSATGGDLPRRIEARRGWVLMQAGQPVEAIRVMQELGRREPDYAWVHQQLVEWHTQRGDWKALRAAARHLVRLQPGNSEGWNYLAEAARNLEDKDEAREAFAKAFALDPHATYAGRNLLDFLIEEKRFEEAAKTLATLEHFTPSLWITIDGIELALARGDEGEFARRLERVLGSEEVHAGHLNYLATLYRKAGRIAPWEVLLNERAKRSDASRALLEAWADMLCRKNKLGKAVRRLEQVRENRAIACGAWAVVLRAVTERNDKAFLKLIKRHWDLLRADPDSRTAGGEGLLHFARHAMVRDWYGDWRQPTAELGPVDLLNLAIAIEETDGRHAAREVREAALMAFPTDRLASFHRAALAFLDVEGGAVEAAERHLAQIEVARLTVYYKVLMHLAKAMVAGQRGDEAGAMREMWAAQQAHDGLKQDQSLHPLYVVAAKQLAPRLPAAKGKYKRLLRKLGMPARIRGQSNLTWVWAALFLLWVVWKILGILAGTD